MQSDTTQFMQPVKGRAVLAWLGGKSKLTSTIIPLIPPHKTYVEVFAGAAWLLFRKPESKVEIINDINADLVGLYRVIQHHLDEFVRYFKWVLVSRDEFDRFLRTAPDTLTDIQRAARFYYMMKCGYGAKLVSPSFSSPSSTPPRLNLLRLEEDLSAAHLRLSRVVIENRPYQRIIPQLDSPDTFFYVDPPYYDCENYYGPGIFSKADFATLRGLLGEAKGKWMMSINDVQPIRDLFAGFRIHEVTLNYSVGHAHGGPKPAAELLICNY